MRADLEARIAAVSDPVVVLDIDSTLLCTGARHLAILRAYARHAGREALAAFAADLTPGDFGWTVDGPLTGTAHESEREALTRFWYPAFFSGDHLAEDEPVAGAVQFARSIHEAGAWLYYLTARDAPGMGAATQEHLLARGFPLLTGRSILHLKPRAGLSDRAFKQGAIADIRRLGTVVATFENDPGNANLLLASFPDALNVLLETHCSPDADEPDPRLSRMKDFSAWL